MKEVKNRMSYIYKLLDEKTAEILNKDSLISLSRPFLAFKSEGKGFKVFRTMFERLNENSDSESLHKDKQLLKEARDWICGYYDSLSPELRNEYNHYGIKSDLQIAMTIFFQTYCGYFTSTNLEDALTRKKYIEDNKQLCYGKNKYVKLSVEVNKLNNLFWTSNKDYHFKCDTRQDDDSINGVIKGTLHIHKIEYSTPSKLKQPFATFNGSDDRQVSSLLKYVNEYYSLQNETRLMFRIPSYRPNESVVGFNCYYPAIHFESFEQQMVYLIKSICLEALKYPEYVYLEIHDFEIKNF